MVTINDLQPGDVFVFVNPGHNYHDWEYTISGWKRRHDMPAINRPVVWRVTHWPTTCINQVWIERVNGQRLILPKRDRVTLPDDRPVQKLGENYYQTGPERALEGPGTVVPG